MITKCFQFHLSCFLRLCPLNQAHFMPLKNASNPCIYLLFCFFEADFWMVFSLSPKIKISIQTFLFSIQTMSVFNPNDVYFQSKNQYKVPQTPILSPQSCLPFLILLLRKLRHIMIHHCYIITIYSGWSIEQSC